MDRREFIKVTSAGLAAVVLPLPFIVLPYNGNCKIKGRYCIGKGSYPFGLEHNPKSGPLLCDYHGSLVYKLKLLSLPALEYLAKHPNNSYMVKHIMDVITSEPKKVIKDADKMHRIRVIAMHMPDKEWKLYHRVIFDCPNQYDRKHISNAKRAIAKSLRAG